MVGQVGVQHNLLEAVSPATEKQVQAPVPPWTCGSLLAGVIVERQKQQLRHVPSHFAE